jgi:hypothetical protein
MDVTKHTREPLISMMSAHPRNILMDHNLAPKSLPFHQLGLDSYRLGWQPQPVLTAYAPTY